MFGEKRVRVLVQGVLGKSGSFHTKNCLLYGRGKDIFIAGSHPIRNGLYFKNMVTLKEVRVLVKELDINVTILFVPQSKVLSALHEAVEAEVAMSICVTEGLPSSNMLCLKDFMNRSSKTTLLLGPNCPGIILPGQFKLGVMPAQIYGRGTVGLVSRSGTLTYEIVHQLNNHSIGQSVVVGIGGDMMKGLGFIDVLKFFNASLATKISIIVGEVGGSEEEEAAEWSYSNFTKPLYGFIAGTAAPEGKQMGHAGALVASESEEVDKKIRTLCLYGIKIIRRVEVVGKLISHEVKRL